MKSVKALALGVAAIAVMLSAAPVFADPIEEVIVTGQRYSDPCLAIAAAKVAQWDQARLRKLETQTFADGSSGWSETIVTENTAFNRTNHVPWHTVAVTRGQRRAGSPATVEKNMGLANCRTDAQAGDDAKTMAAYLFDYAPNKDGSVPSGKMAISDATGVPLRQELQESTQPADRKLPMKVRIEYSYGNDVQVPNAARLAESSRRQRTAQCVRTMQDPVGEPGGC